MFLNFGCVQVFGSILAVSGGLELGKEGPLIHTGSCVASLLGQGGSKRYHLTWRWLRFFKNDQDRRDFVTCGAAAGVAAAFRAPIGDVLFALEEIVTWYVNISFAIHTVAGCMHKYPYYSYKLQDIRI